MKEKIIEGTKDFIIDTLKKQKTISPKTILFSRDEEKTPNVFMELDYTNDLSKELCHKKISKLLLTGNFYMFIHIAESYLVKSNVSKEEAMKIKPSNHPDKQDVIVITCKSDDGKGCFIVIPFKIHNQEVTIDKIEKIDISNENMSGRIWDMWQ